jgi:hypothetical protein
MKPGIPGRILLMFLVLLWTATARGDGDLYQMKARTSRTAIWVGDRLDYVVRIEHSPAIEFVLDHLKKEEMNLQPFELLDVSTASGQLPMGRRFFEVHLRLTIYDTGHADAVIPSFNLFYFRQGQAAGKAKDDTPAEILPVPPFPVGIRSTLTDTTTGIRDQKDPLPIRMRTWLWPGLLGLCGIALLAGYGTWIAMVQIRSEFWKHKLAERARKKSLSESLQEIRSAPAESPEELAAFYKKAADVVRGLAAEKLGDGAGLTARELETELKKAGAGERQATAMSYLIEQCDLVRYSPGGLEEGRRLRPEFLRKFEELAEYRS